MSLDLAKLNRRLAIAGMIATQGVVALAWNGAPKLALWLFYVLLVIITVLTLSMCASVLVDAHREESR